MKKSFCFFFLCMALATISCSDKNANEKDVASGVVITLIVSEKQKFIVDTIATGLNNPWGIAFLPDGRMLITERAGEIRIIKGGKLMDEKIQGVPAVYAQG
jgi:glucose/arabinose dehydrogenase